MYLTPTWFRGVAKALVSSTIARMPRRDICWTQMCFRPLERSYASFLLADRPPHVRHGLPRIASVAQAYDRRPLEDRTRLPSQPCRSVRRQPMSDKSDLRNISTPVSSLNLLLLRDILSFMRTDSWIRPRRRNRFASGLVSMSNGVVSSHGASNSGRRIPALLQAAMHALSTPGGQADGKGSLHADLPRSWPTRQPGWRRASHTWKSPSGRTDAENHDRPTKCDCSMRRGHGIDLNRHFLFRRRAASEVGPSRT